MKNININRYIKTETPIHKATQLLAFLGKKLGEEKADDSQTTVVYETTKDALIGKPITINGQIYVAELRFRDFNLAIVSDDNSEVFTLEGKSIPEVLAEFQKRMDVNLPDFELHYELPDDYDLQQYILVQPERAALTEWAEIRQMAAETFAVVNTIITPPSAINIWPHHFDTGTYHVLKTGAKGDTASVGCGFAIADTVVNEPYFYIYGWVKDATIDFDNAPDLTFGEWKTGDWKGAVLPLSVVKKLPNLNADLEAFFATTFRFFKSKI
jgi:hypothetical protein